MPKSSSYVAATSHNRSSTTGGATEGVKGAYRTDIDGLRAIAVLCVVLFHALPPHLSGGFIGVDIFFVISGYLIGAHVYRDVSAGKFTIARFYARRAKRILPALFGVVAFCCLLGPFLLSATELKAFAAFLVATLCSLSNVDAWRLTDYFAPAAALNPLLMTWSLGAEEQFYIVFPLIMILLARVQRGRTSSFRKLVLWAVGIATLLSFALSVVGTASFPTATYYLLPGRAWELGVGVMLAAFEMDSPFVSSASAHLWPNIRSAAGLIVILVAVATYGQTTPFPGVAALAPVAGAALLLTSPTAWLNTRLLSLPTFRWIGLVSYSWYLWHWPLLSYARICSDRPLRWNVGLVLALIALLIAGLSYRFVEQPFRASKARNSTLLLRYAVVTLAFASYGGALYVGRGLPQRFPDLSAREANVDDISTSCLAPDDSSDLILGPACTPPPDGRPAIALWADSHGAAIETALRELAQKSGFRLYAFNHVQCPPLLRVVPSSSSIRKDRTCSVYNDNVLRFLSRDRTVQTVILAGDWSGPGEWAWESDGYVHMPERAVALSQSDANLEFGLNGTVSNLQAAGKRVILLNDIEALRFQPVLRLRESMIPVRKWINHHLLGAPLLTDDVGPEDLYFNENQQGAVIVDRVATKLRAITFDMRSHLCTANRCKYRSGNTLLYFDTNHLTRAGARIALDGLPRLWVKPSDSVALPRPML
jgi:peptidoglycan/LPS O-acetylase OafA/YrhL